MTTSSPLSGMVEDLNKLLSDLPPKDAEFAASLCAQYLKKGTLSPKQEPWIERLLSKALTGNFVSGDTPMLVGAAALYKLFFQGSKQYKEVSIMCPGFGVVHLKVAGPKANEPGTLTMTDGKPYGEGRWYGRIRREGHVSWGRAVSDMDRGLILKGLEYAAECLDPDTVAWLR